MPIEIDITGLVINWEAILRWADLPFFILLWRLISRGGWVFFVILTFVGLKEIIAYRAELIKEKNTQYVLLAIDVPKDNPHGPEVTERLFAHLATAGSTKGLKKDSSIFTQPRFSFEIISLGGRIQFLVRTPQEYRDLVEAAFYGEYPNAEIHEVDDYTKEAPEKFPHPDYNLWGTEIVLYNQDSYPIRTYPSFEHSLSGEFKDPMSNILEVLNRIREGEQVWLQILITFGGLAWKKRGERLVNKLIGTKPKEEGGGLAVLIWKLFESVSTFIYDTIFGGVYGIGEKSIKEEPPSLISFLSPGEKDVVAAIQRKISKIGYRTKFRIIYLARKEVYDVHRVIPGVLGMLNQFNTLDMNGFKPDDTVKTVPPSFSLAPTKGLIRKQNEILKAYRERSFRRGTNGYILNIEELATLYHFPVATVEAPLIKKTGSKKGEPPFTLPIKETF
ncbi:MAG: hypothetical protein N2259_02695 [Patescibacteria group bacterium]|nr:hypothetical protein [Patescibacteria group bacterium]